VQVERLMSPGAFTWDVITGERVFSSSSLSNGFPEQSLVYADVNSNPNLRVLRVLHHQPPNNPNLISILPGWQTLNL
jgi:hypothetical protein